MSTNRTGKFDMTLHSDDQPAGQVPALDAFLTGQCGTVPHYNSDECDRICRLAEEACELLQDKDQETWDSYMAIGAAFLIGRQWAFDMSGTSDINNPKYKKAFSTWLNRYPKLAKFDSSDRAKLFVVMENRDAIESWRATLGLTARLKLNHPTSVLKRWQASTQVPKKSDASKVSPVAKLRQEITELKRQHELDEERLAAADGGDLWDLKKTSAEDIAACIVGNVGSLLNATKARKIATEILRLLDDKPNPPKAPAPTRRTRIDRDRAVAASDAAASPIDDDGPASSSASHRSASAKQAAKTRARMRLAQDYGERFGHVTGVQEDWFPALMKGALESGVDDPRLIARKQEIEQNGREFDRKQMEFLATPITADTEREYTALIKQRRLYEGACMLAWEQYFKFRDQHADCEPLTSDDLEYAGHWTACACATTSPEG
jgi:hypothetical protein